jgi:hypothetical protein
VRRCAQGVSPKSFSSKGHCLSKVTNSKGLRGMAVTVCAAGAWGAGGVVSSWGIVSQTEEICRQNIMLGRRAVVVADL